MAKVFYVQNSIGKAKYVVNYHDGIKQHNDGSKFFDIKTFRSLSMLNLFVCELKKDGYNLI